MAHMDEVLRLRARLAEHSPHWQRKRAAKPRQQQRKESPMDIMLAIVRERWGGHCPFDPSEYDSSFSAIGRLPVAPFADVVRHYRWRDYFKHLSLSPDGNPLPNSCGKGGKPRQHSPASRPSTAPVSRPEQDVVDCADLCNGPRITYTGTGNSGSRAGGSSGRKSGKDSRSGARHPAADDQREKEETTPDPFGRVRPASGSRTVSSYNVTPAAAAGATVPAASPGTGARRPLQAGGCSAPPPESRRRQWPPRSQQLPPPLPPPFSAALSSGHGHGSLPAARAVTKRRGAEGLVEKLWEDLHVPAADRTYFRRRYLTENRLSPSRDDAVAADEVLRLVELLLEHHAATVAVLAAVGRREACLATLAEAFRHFCLSATSDGDGSGSRSNGDGDGNNRGGGTGGNNSSKNCSGGGGGGGGVSAASVPPSERERAVALLQLLGEAHGASAAVLAAVAAWRRQLWRPLPFTWRGRNYLLEMQRDASFLDSVQGGKMLLSVGLTADDLPLLLCHDAGGSVGAGSAPQGAARRGGGIENAGLGAATTRTMTMLQQEEALQAALRKEAVALRDGGHFIPLLKWLTTTAAGAGVLLPPGRFPSGATAADVEAAAATAAKLATEDVMAAAAGRQRGGAVSVGTSSQERSSASAPKTQRSASPSSSSRASEPRSQKTAASDDASAATARSYRNRSASSTGSAWSIAGAGGDGGSSSGGRRGGSGSDSTGGGSGEGATAAGSGSTRSVDDGAQPSATDAVNAREGGASSSGDASAGSSVPECEVSDAENGSAGTTRATPAAASGGEGVKNGRVVGTADDDGDIAGDDEEVSYRADFNEASDYDVSSLDAGNDSQRAGGEPMPTAERPVKAPAVARDAANILAAAAAAVDGKQKEEDGIAVSPAVSTHSTAPENVASSDPSTERRAEAGAGSTAANAPHSVPESGRGDSASGEVMTSLFLTSRSASGPQIDGDVKIPYNDGSNGGVHRGNASGVHSGSHSVALEDHEGDSLELHEAASAAVTGGSPMAEEAEAVAAIRIQAATRRRTTKRKYDEMASRRRAAATTVQAQVRGRQTRAAAARAAAASAAAAAAVTAAAAARAVKEAAAAIRIQSTGRRFLMQRQRDETVKQEQAQKQRRQTKPAQAAVATEAKPTAAEEEVAAIRIQAMGRCTTAKRKSGEAAKRHQAAAITIQARVRRWQAGAAAARRRDDWIAHRAPRRSIVGPAKSVHDDGAFSAGADTLHVESRPVSPLKNGEKGNATTALVPPAAPVTAVAPEMAHSVAVPGAALASAVGRSGGAAAAAATIAAAAAAVATVAAEPTVVAIASGNQPPTATAAERVAAVPRLSLPWTRFASVEDKATAFLMAAGKMVDDSNDGSRVSGSINGGGGGSSGDEVSLDISSESSK